MVGHTGIKAAAIKAVEVVDTCVGKVFAATERVGGVLLVTADHGNAEKMTDQETFEPHTAHTTGPVPFLVAGSATKSLKIKNGKLADIAPTILNIMQLNVPQEMTGESLIA
jgi:2,3-bisphosphoglycerate-independent phosphoglycerate mutase